MTAVEISPDEAQRCRCGEAFFWAYSEASVSIDSPLSMPINLAPVEDGNVEIIGRHRGVPVARVHAQTPLFEPEGPLYHSHFVTCPDADKFRKNR